MRNTAQVVSVLSSEEIARTGVTTNAGKARFKGIEVESNLLSIGGSAVQAFFDDGTNGDETAGDNVFSYSATVVAMEDASLLILHRDVFRRRVDALSRTHAVADRMPPTGALRKVERGLWPR